MNPTIEIRNQFDNLYALIKKFVAELKQQKLHSVRYFQLPEVLSVQENTLDESIEVTEYFNNEAFIKCCDAFLDLFKKDEISTKVMKRHPGIIVVNSAEAETLIKTIELVNVAKKKFKNTILNLGNNDKKFEIVHKAIPQLITLAAYRNIHYEINAPYSVRFTWMNKHSIKLLTKKDALKLLDNSYQYGQSNIFKDSSWHELVNKEILRITELSDKTKLRIRRPTRVSPQVNVRFNAKSRYHVSAALPFIIINASPDIKLGTLKNYCKKSKDPRKVESNFLIERLYMESVK